MTRRLHLVDLIEMRSLKSAGHKSNQRGRNAREYTVVSILKSFKAQKGHVRVSKRYELDTKPKKHVKGLDKLYKTH